MPEYRTPEEERVQHEHRCAIQAVLDQAVADGASLLAAVDLGEPADVVKRWINTLWDGLRDNLSDDRPDCGGLRMEDRLTAIVMLLQDQMYEEADALLSGVRAAGGGGCE